MGSGWMMDARGSSRSGDSNQPWGAPSGISRPCKISDWRLRRSMYCWCRRPHRFWRMEGTRYFFARPSMPISGTPSVFASRAPTALPFDEQQVVSEAVALRHLELADCDAASRRQVVSSRSWTFQPASTRSASMRSRASASGPFGGAIRSSRPDRSAPGVLAIRNRARPSRDGRSTLPRSTARVFVSNLAQLPV